MPASRFTAWAGDPAYPAVTRVTRVTHPSDPSICDSLDHAAEATRAVALRVAGVTRLSSSGNVVTQNAMPRLPRNFSRYQYGNLGYFGNQLNEECSSPLKIDADSAWWRDFFEERAAIREIDGQRPRAEAEQLAFGEIILEWQRRHGTRPGFDHCAGCGKVLSEEGGLLLSEGTRVHLDGEHGVDCMIVYGQKWRAAAVAALRALGLDPPPGFEPE